MLPSDVLYEVLSNTNININRSTGRIFLEFLSITNAHEVNVKVRGNSGGNVR